jgi:glucans biosynthesis protein
MATTAATRVGAGPKDKTRHFVIDFVGGRLAELAPDAPVDMVIKPSEGTVNDKIVQPNPMLGGWRVSFVLNLGDAKFCDMRCHLTLGDTRLSEIWMYRWSP